MPRRMIFLPLATLSATGLLCISTLAQSGSIAGLAPNSNSVIGSAASAEYLQSQPAPIERAQAAPNQNGYASAPMQLSAGKPLTTTANMASAQAAPGVWLRVGQNAVVNTVSVGNDSTELRVVRGVANVTVHHPADGSQILIDLPGGQTSLLKDGLYTFNAGTNTVRVLRGEADAYPGTNHDAKPIKVKEDHAVVFSAAKVKAEGFDPYEARADVLPSTGEGGGYGYRGAPAYAPYGYGPYGDGFYGGYPYAYPYYGYGWGYPYAWDYPYFGWGYPYIGFGFGYYGGFRSGFGGFRGRR